MKKLALVIIDMQKAYFNNDALEVKRETLTTACNELTANAKANDIPVFSVVTKHQKDGSTWTLNMIDDRAGYLFTGETDSEVVEGLDVTGAVTIVKTRDSAFYETELLEQLRQRDIETVVLAGVSTHTCVFQTAADAYARNIRVILARDAIASHDPGRHDSALDVLETEYRQASIANPKIAALMSK